MPHEVAKTTTAAVHAMADQEEPHSLSSTFPNPPPFWKDFTAERVARLDELRKQHALISGVGEEANLKLMRVPDLSDELATLQPPPEPVDGRWRVFGDQYMVSLLLYGSAA